MVRIQEYSKPAIMQSLELPLQQGRYITLSLNKHVNALFYFHEFLSFVESADVELVFKDLKDKLTLAYDMYLNPGEDYHLVNKLQPGNTDFLHQARAEAKSKYSKYTAAKYSWRNRQTEFSQKAFSEAENLLRNFINSYTDKLFPIFTTLRIKQVRIISSNNPAVLIL